MYFLFLYYYFFGSCSATSNLLNYRFIESNNTKDFLKRLPRTFSTREFEEKRIINESVENGMQLAYKNCRRITQTQLWNCPIDDFASQRKLPVTKEVAFMESLSAAAIMYKVMKECFDGKLSGCGCRKRTHTGACKKCIQDSDWKSISRFAKGVVMNYLSPNHKMGLKDVRHHNIVFGISIVRKSKVISCKHRWLGKCISQCLAGRLIPFQNIAHKLKKSWKNPIKLDSNDIGWYTQVPNTIFRKSLVHVVDSPDYCIYNSTTGTGEGGTNGRICYEDKITRGIIDARKNKICKRLCYSCGHEVDWRISQELVQCNCRIEGCCNVACETCTINTTIYYCSSQLKRLS